MLQFMVRKWFDKKCEKSVRCGEQHCPQLKLLLMVDYKQIKRLRFNHATGQLVFAPS